MQLFEDEKTKEIVEKLENCSDDEFTIILHNACLLNDFSVLKNLCVYGGVFRVTDTIKANPIIIKDILDNHYYSLIEYLMLETTLKKDFFLEFFEKKPIPKEIINIITLYDYKKSFNDLCLFGKPNELYLILNSPIFEIYPEKYSLISMGTLSVVQNNKKEHLEVILTSQKAKPFLDDLIYFSLDSAAMFEMEDIAKYLIFDLKIKRTPEIDSIINFDPLINLEQMFNARDLNNSLQSELSQKESDGDKKTKI